MWVLKSHFGIGGLREMGFYQDTNYLLLLSDQGRGLFDCLTGEKIARDRSDYYFEEWDSKSGIVTGIGELQDKEILCGGFEYPDLLDKEMTPALKAEIMREQREIWNGTIREVEVLYITDGGQKTEVYHTPYGINRAFGFSKNGRCFVVGTSSDLYIWINE